jgi:hypothetical protein
LPSLFDANVTFSILNSNLTKNFALNQERRYIKLWSTTLRQHGYNMLKGDPGAAKRFHYLKNRRLL